MDLLTTPPEFRLPVPLKHFAGRFGLLAMRGDSPEGLMVTDRESGVTESHRLIDDLLNARLVLDRPIGVNGPALPA